MYRKSFIKLYTDNNFSFDEARNEVDFILDVEFGYTSKDFILGKILENGQISKVEKIINERVKTGRPIQQILGRAYFCGRKFFVNENTLIPRPETEILVDEVLKLTFPFNNEIKILDIGTGSGCIPVSLVLGNRNINVHAVDISSLAIETAKKNALFHNVYQNIKFYESDLFENVHEKFDVIVSNPPYIPIKDRDSLQPEVKDYDPDLALFAYDEDGIDFYKRIILSAENYLLPNGYICFELGVKQCKLVSDILKHSNYKNIRAIKDLNSIERIIISQK